MSTMEIQRLLFLLFVSCIFVSSTFGNEYIQFYQGTSNYDCTYESQVLENTISGYDTFYYYFNLTNIYDPSEYSVYYTFSELTGEIYINSETGGGQYVYECGSGSSCYSSHVLTCQIESSVDFYIYIENEEDYDVTYSVRICLSPSCETNETNETTSVAGWLIAVIVISLFLVCCIGPIGICMYTGVITCGALAGCCGGSSNSTGTVVVQQSRPTIIEQSTTSVVQQPIPYGQQPISYGQQPIPYGQQPISYGQQPIPYGQQPIPYGQQPIPYGQQPIPYGQQPIPYGQQPPMYVEQTFANV